MMSQAYTPTPAPPEAHQDEHRHAYGMRLLMYAFANGPGLLSDEQLDLVIHVYPAVVWHLSPTTCTASEMAERMAKFRRQLTNSETSRREQRRERDARISAWLKANGIDPEAQAAQVDGPGGQEDQGDQAQISDTDRALKLLRAALHLIMNPGSDGPQGPQTPGGGSRVPRPTPPPTRPPTGAAASLPQAQPTRTQRAADAGLIPGRTQWPSSPAPQAQQPQPPTVDDLGF